MIKQASLEQLEHSIQAAARAAALEDGILNDNNNNNDNDFINDDNISIDGNNHNNSIISKNRIKNSLRRGKWTTEEEAYANRLINEFKLGLLPLTDGTTLRTFLSKLLNCDPMRISKKFVGQNCIGKQVFRRRQCDLEKLSNEDIEASRTELAELERKFLERVVQSNRTKTAPKDGKMNSNSNSSNNNDDSNGQTIPPWMIPPSETVNTYNNVVLAGNSAKETNNNNNNNTTTGAIGKAGVAARPKNKNKNNQNNQNPSIQIKSEKSMSNNPEQQVSTLSRISSLDYIRELVGSRSSTMHRENSLEFIPNFDMTSHISMDNLQGYGGMGQPTMSSLWPSLNDLAEASKIIAASEEQAENDRKRHSNECNQYVADQSITNYSNDVGYAIDSSPPLQSVGRKQFNSTNGSFGSSSGFKRLKTESTEQLEKSNGEPTVMPKNSSVDNFWILVNSGDIPHPSNGVLSEPILHNKEQQNIYKN